MNDDELVTIDKLVCDLRRVSTNVHIRTDAEFAVAASFSIDKACRLINKLTKNVIILEFEIKQQKGK